MRLTEYIEQNGDEAVHRQLRGRIRKLKVRTVKSWRLGDRRPRPKAAKAIVELTPVTYEGIYGPAA